MPTTSERIEAALIGDLRMVKVTMTHAFRAECALEAERRGRALDAWIVAAMVHMLQRPDCEAQHLEVVEYLRAENEALARRLADIREAQDG